MNTPEHRADQVTLTMTFTASPDELARMVFLGDDRGRRSIHGLVGAAIHGRRGDQLRADLERIVADSDEINGAMVDAAVRWACLPAIDGYHEMGLRAAVVDGHADELDALLADADSLERQARALRALVAHTEAHHPLAQRRRRRRREALAVS